MRPLGALPKTPDPALVVHCFTQRGTTVLTFDRLTRDGDRLKNQNIIYRQVALAHDARVFGRSKLPAKMSIAEFLRAVDARLPRDVAVTLHYDGSKHVNRIREIPRN